MIDSKGFSLIEVLCAVSIGFIVVLMAMTLYFHTRQSHILARAFSDIQENGQFAAYILRTWIEQAGLIGKARLSRTFPVIHDGLDQNRVITYSNHIKVFQGQHEYFVPALPDDVQFVPKSGSDVILVRFVSAMTNCLVELNGRSLIVALNPEFQAGDDIAIFDEKHAVLAHVISRSFGGKMQYLLLSQHVDEQFLENAEVGKLEQFVFFVGKTARKNRLGEKIYALYMLDERLVKVELVPNVIRMKAKCFKSVNNRLRNYSCVKINELDGVAVQIDLLLRSEDIVFNSPRVYWFDGRKTDSLYLYQTFHIIVPLMAHRL